MMEQTNMLLNKCDAKFLSSRLDGRVVLAAERSGDVFDPGPSGAEDVVDEWELIVTLA